jgi:hypothetical protein
MAAGATVDIMRVKEIFVEQNAAAISLDFYQSQNYTPADVMRRWAMATYHAFFRDMYFTPYIRISGTGKAYYYDHWSIEKHDDGTETVTVYLVARD